MREILFRGKRRDNGEWVEGSLLCFKGFSIFDAAVWKNYFTVDSDTIGQYTGLMDKNGKRIFEGDVVIICEPETETVYRCVWDNVNFEFCFVNSEESFGIAYISNEFVEIIGNIHDQKELLHDN